MSHISENDLIEWVSNSEDLGPIERILWIDPIRNFIITIEINNEKALPIRHNYDEYLELLNVKPYQLISWINKSISFLPDQEIPKKHLDIREKAWEIVGKIVAEEPDIYDAKLRGVMVKEVQEKTGVHKSTIYRYLRRFWQGGKVKNVLLPYYQNCGGDGIERSPGSKKRGRPRKFEDDLKTGINIDADIQRCFRSGVRLFYNTKVKAPLKRAYQQTLEKFFNIGYLKEGNVSIPILPEDDQLPTFGQFKYWFNKERDLKESLISRYGKSKYELKYRENLGSSTYKSFGPGSRFQIDATIADVYLVNQFKREWIIGRPVVYVVIDVFSRMITGVYVGLEGPSWLGAMMALANTTMDKVKFCAEYDIEIKPEDWPCSHLPQKLTADRGELEGHMPTNLINTLGVIVENTPPYRADWKGIVEQQFRLFNLRSIKWVPGAVQARAKERGERDYRLDAKMTLREFTQIIIENVLYHNNENSMRWYQRNEFMVSENVESIPRELWYWGIQNRTGRLKKIHEDIVKLNLLYQGTAVVTSAGIRFKGVFYGCELALKDQWFVKARTKGSWQVKISYDPRITDVIYLWLDEGKRFETCTLLEREERYKNKRFEEVEDLIEIERSTANKRENDNLRAKIKLDAHIKAIVKDAEKKTNQALEDNQLSGRKRILEVRNHRKEEKEINREREAFRLGEDNKQQQGQIISLESKKADQKKIEYVPPADKLSKIKSLLREDEGEDE